MKYLFYDIFACARGSCGLFLAGLLVLLAVQIPAEAIAEVHIPVGSHVYKDLDRLEAEGLITTGLLETKPLTRNEAARLVREAEASPRFPVSGDSVKASIERLRREFGRELEDIDSTYLKSIDKLYLKYLYSDGATPFSLNKNNRGNRIQEGPNVRTGFTAMGSFYRYVSFYLNPEFRYSPDDNGFGDNDFQLVEGYAALQAFNMEATFGRESLWWGPGYNGALFLTDNAKPFDLLKLTNPRPATLPWLLKYLGPFQFTFFLTRLEEDRDYSSPYLAGIRLQFKPHSSLAIGFSRVALFGGEGREVHIWNTLWSKKENGGGPTEPGDQIAGGDFKLIIPWAVQPFTLYAEIGGEDGAGGMPSHVAYVGGFYMPRLLNFDALSLRGEYARNFVPGHPGVWYTHHLYKSGYTYKGTVIGHFMNTDSRDYYLESTYDAKQYGTFTASLEELKNRVFKTPGYARAASVHWERYFGLYKVKLGYVFDRLKNFESSNSGREDVHSIFSEVEFSF